MMSARTTVATAITTAALVALVVFWPAREVSHAQPRRPTAGLTSVAATESVAAGTSSRLALQVSLPEGYHVQSNAPREAAFIPTVLSVESPAGLTVTEIVYPPATDLAQAGQSQPLAVFEREFAIGVVVSVPASAPPGEIVVPARLRYQACDAQLCYAPATASTEWRLRVVGAGTAVPTPSSR